MKIEIKKEKEALKEVIYVVSLRNEEGEPYHYTCLAVKKTFDEAFESYNQAIADAKQCGIDTISEVVRSTSFKV